VVGDTVYVSAAASAGTNVYALSRATGSILWEHSIGATYPWSGIVYDDTSAGGRIFVVNSDGLLTGLDASTGSAVWSTKLPGQYSFSSPPTAVNGIVYVGGAGSGGTLYATDERNGTLLWSQPVANGDNSSPAVDGPNVYVTYPDNYYAFNRSTGAPVWYDYLGGDGGGGRTPVVADGHLYIRDWAGSPLIASSATRRARGRSGRPRRPRLPTASPTRWRVRSGAGPGRPLDKTGLAPRDGHSRAMDICPGDKQRRVGRSTSGEIYALSCATGAPLWSADAGSPISPPDEQNVSQPLTGLGVGGNALIVPAGSTLVAYTASSTAGAGGTFTGSGSGGTSPGSAGAQPVTTSTGTAPGPAGAQPVTTSTGTTPQAPKRSWRTREATLLRRELLLHTTVKGLLTHRRMVLKLASLRPGRLAFAWSLAPAGGRPRHPLMIAVAVRMKRSGTVHLTLRLKAAVVRTLRHARHGLVVAGTATFAPNSGPKVKVRRSFRIAV
jgi:outer membrane protein assembly factor BamB